MDAALAHDRPSLDALLRSVVKVLTVSDAPDYEQPWQTEGPETSQGSGVVVDTPRGMRVLTNGHCVQDHVFVEVRRYDSPRKQVAEVEALGHQCDLAVLRIDEPSFFEGIVPVPLGELPRVSDAVSVCGYPVGGERLSVTQGIVSRIDLVRYAQSQRRLLAVQIDAAINEGNSGGPVLRDGRLVGIAFQALEDAQQIGYIIPVPVVEHFLRDVTRGSPTAARRAVPERATHTEDGFPELGVVTQLLESPAQRRSLGLPPDDDDGVLITQVAFGSSAWDVLRPGDVLLEVDGVPIASDGTVPMGDGGMIHFSYVVSRRHVGETVPLLVWRGVEEQEHEVRLEPPRYLVAEDRYDVRPSYFVFGGLLLVPLTRNYLRTYDDPWWQQAPQELMALYDHGVPTPERVEPVVLQKVLADRVNDGYHDFESLLVTSAQDIRVRSLEHLVSIVDATRDEFVRFGLADGRQVVVDRRLAEARHDAILARYGVPADRSED
ncbi:MAG: S1C family serine protease, partial [Polyangiales bacterium]